MADIWTAAKRSFVMSRIRSRGNKETEQRLAKILRSASLVGWRRHQPLFGKPDFVFQSEKVAVFVDGCFWHGCPRCYVRPKSNRPYWAEKLARNRMRDRLVTRELRRKGWTVLRIWQHQLQDGERVARRVRKVLNRTH